MSQASDRLPARAGAASRPSSPSRWMAALRPGMRRAAGAARSPLGAPLETVVEGALRPVAAPPAFREQLRSNLTLAAQHRQLGLAVEAPRPAREALLLAASAAALAVAIAIGVALSLSRPRPCAE